MMAINRRSFLATLSAALGGVTLAREPANGTDSKPRRMIRRPLPGGSRAGLPVIGMGTWNTFDVEGSARERARLTEVLEAFYAAGSSVIDSSPMYGRAEEVTGELVAELGREPSTFYATKVWTRGLSDGRAQIERSFRRLKTQRIDLLQVHNLLDWRTHLPTLRSLKAEGRIRYIGLTHYTVSAHEEIESVLRTGGFDFAQFNYSIATRAAERRLLPYCRDQGIGVLINRPFEEGGLFTRVGNRPLPAYAAEIGCASWAQFFLKFIVSHPAVTCVIPATSRVAHMRDNVQAGFGELPDAKLRERMASEMD